MNEALIQKVSEFINESFPAGRNTPTHLQITADCVKELKPKADVALIIAALSHDIDRGFVKRHIAEDQFNKQPYLKDHQESSANIISEFLRKNDADEELVKRVWHLVSKHEEGGDEDQNILKDADSLSFFRGRNVESIARNHPEIPLKPKIAWLYERITSDKAKELAKPLYEKALKLAEQL